MLKYFSSSAASRRSDTLVSRAASADRWVQRLLDQRLATESQGRQSGRTTDDLQDGMIDLRLAGPGEPHQAGELFDRLRWGGSVAVMDTDPNKLIATAQQYENANGFAIEQPVGDIWHAPLGLRVPGFTPRAWYFVARKTDLVRPEEDSKRSTYDVVLTPDDHEPEGFCVTKRVPTVEGVLRRINARFPNLDPTAAKQRARKLVGDVFPLFLTRETKCLELLHKRLPEHLRCRVPKPLRIGRDKRGLVTRLDMNWLRNGRVSSMSQAEFAASAMELLAALHDDAKIMHLDLRLDNMVITEDGVGFVDFGTSAQIDEDLSNRPVLNKLFMELMQTSEVQKVLSDMLARGEVTSASLRDVAGKPDRGMDIFYLAVQINHPHFNPELARLIDYDSNSGEARTLHALSAAVLRPKNPAMSQFKNARDLLRGVKRVERRNAA